MKIAEDKTIQAQQECLRAIRKAAKFYEAFANELEQAGLCENAQVVIEPYNNGYRATFSIKVEWDSPLYRYNHVDFRIEPDTFFDKEYGLGQGVMKFYFPATRGAEDNYIKMGINNDRDIKGCADAFVILTKNSIPRIKKEVDFEALKQTETN